MVDYSSREPAPPIWPLPPHPPVRHANAARRYYLAPFLALSAVLGSVYVYFNQDEGMQEYWRQVDQGNVPLDDDDDEDYDDDEEDEWEDDDDNDKK